MSAMFTQRKMFSSSLVISAARVEETGTTVSMKRAYMATACSVHAGGDAADDLRRVLRLVDRVARVDALGREREVEVRAHLQAAAPRGSAG